MRNNQLQKQFKNETPNWHQFNNILSARKLFRSVPLDKKVFNKWNERENSIFIIANNNFNIPITKEEKIIQNSRKKFITENVKLFPTHFTS